MSQKKCPKCGEMNPPEAVMCWACYTPLSGGAAAAATGSPPASSPVVGGSGEGLKKPVTPAQMGVIGVALLLGAGFGIKTFLAPANGGGDDGEVTQPPAEENPQPATTPPPPSQAPGVPVPAPAPPPGGVGTPVPAAFSIVAIPNPQYTWGTMAIVLNKPNATASDAASIASYVRQKMMQNKRWVILHIYVFTDKDAAAKFKAFQARRKGAPLGNSDYTGLADLWSNVPVRYEYNRGSEGVLWPSRSPGGWWNQKPVYTRVKS